MTLLLHESTKNGTYLYYKQSQQTMLIVMKNNVSQNEI